MGSTSDRWVVHTLFVRLSAAVRLVWWPTSVHTPSFVVFSVASCRSVLLQSLLQGVTQNNATGYAIRMEIGEYIWCTQFSVPQVSDSIVLQRFFSESLCVAATKKSYIAMNEREGVLAKLEVKMYWSWCWHEHCKPMPADTTAFVLTLLEFSALVCAEAFALYSLCWLYVIISFPLCWQFFFMHCSFCF